MGKLQAKWVFVKSLDVELLLFLTCVANTAYGTGAGTLTTQKICFPDRPPGISEVCSDDKAIRETAELNEVKGMVKAFLPAVVVIFFGSWRDITHRSLPLIIISLLCLSLSVGIELSSAILWTEADPWLFTILSSVVEGLGGSTGVMTMASLSTVTENSTPEEKAMRMPVLMVAMLGGLALSMAISGMLLNLLNYVPFFIMVIVLFILCLLLSLVLVKDKPTPRTGGYCESVTHLRLIFLPRHNTIQIWVFIVAISFTTTILAAEGTVGYLYLQKKFKATPQEASPLGGFRMALAVVGAGVSTPLLKGWLKLSDFTVCAICVIPSVTSAIGNAFAQSLQQMYIFGALDSLRITFISTMINLFTGCLKKSEIGIFTSFLGFTEGALPLALNPLYVHVFKATVDTFPGAFYIISASSIFLSGILIWSLSCSYKTSEGTEASEQHLENHDSHQDTDSP